MAPAKKAQAPKMAKFGFLPITATQEKTMIAIAYKYDERGHKYSVPLVDSVKKETVLRPGDSYEIPEEDLKILMKKGLVRSKDKIAERDLLIENKTPLERMSDEERKLVLTDQPQEL